MSEDRCFWCGADRPKKDHDCGAAAWGYDDDKEPLRMSFRPQVQRIRYLPGSLYKKVKDFDQADVDALTGGKGPEQHRARPVPRRRGLQYLERIDLRNVGD